MAMTSILVCDTDTGFARIVAEIAASLPNVDVRQVAESGHARAHGLQSACDVVLFGPSISADEAFAAARSLREANRPTSVLLVTKGVSAELLRKALKAGVDDVLEQGCPVMEVESSLREAVAAAQRRAASDRGSEAVQSPKGEVITVFSTKGGVGKTVVATNLAVAIAGMGKSVALVDLDLQFGDVGIMLGLEPVRTIVGAVQSGERLDHELLDGYLLEHSANLRVLLAPTQPEDAEMVTASRIDRILGLLAEKFDYVIVDTPPSLDEAVLTALDKSTSVIAIAMMDVASIKNTRISLQKLGQLGYNNAIVDVLLNRADSKVLLKPEDVEQAIGARIKYRLPSDPQIPRSLNKGVPVVRDMPKSQPARVLLAIAKSIVETAEEVRSDVA